MNAMIFSDFLRIRQHYRTGRALLAVTRCFVPLNTPDDLHRMARSGKGLCKFLIVAERPVIPANEPESRKQNSRCFWMPDQVRHDETVDFSQPILDPFGL
jgi:hypothetical protein